MDILAFLDVLWRRRWVVVPALIAVVALTLGVAKLVKPQYHAASTVVLYAPTIDNNTAKPIAGPTNPLLGVSGLHDVTDVMVARMLDPVVVKELGTSKGWTVTNDDGSSTPLLMINAQQKTPEEALALSTKLDSLVEQQLVQLQTTNGTASKYLVHSRLVQQDTQASAVRGSRVRAMAGTAGLGVLLVISLAFAVDAIREARARKSPRSRRAAKRSKRSAADSVRDSGSDQQGPDNDNDVAAAASVGVAPSELMARRAHARDV